MIWESCYWKDPLLDIVEQIEFWELSSNLDESDFAEIERQITIGFYSVRKLIDAKKLSDSVAQGKLNCLSFANINEVNLLNWHRYYELYDLHSPSKKELNLDFVYNQFIHSYVFSIDNSESSSFTGIFFCSDRYRNKSLFHISSLEIKRIFHLVGTNYPYTSIRQFNPQNKDYKIVQE